MSSKDLRKGVIRYSIVLLNNKKSGIIRKNKTNNVDFRKVNLERYYYLFYITYGGIEQWL